MYTFRFAKDLNFETWEASNGLLHRFCMQYGVLSKHITGESLDCPDYTQFMEEVLTPLLMQYEPQGETSLYYKCLPDRTYAFEHERVHVFPIWLNSYCSNYCRLNDFCLSFLFIFIFLFYLGQRIKAMELQGPS